MASDEIASDPPSEPGTQAPEQLGSTWSTASKSAAARRVIGPYHLLERLGAGGMGEVWLAEQREPVQRRVALKLIRAGMDSEQVLARFESERQALALMDHPSIARILDAGTTTDGRPYFVMEHIAGVSILEHCSRNRLTTAERLALMLHVCEGVQHAHQKAVIHRDLKPSNVLVTSQDGRAVPKIIDFGLAKALSQRLTDRTLHTELGVLVGTPEYMSPEQAERTLQDVDTRTDVYSLGVILYELLTGALPFESRRLREAGYDGIPRILREEDPPLPSLRASRQSAETSGASARERGTDPAMLKRQLTGDLDWITMKALEKDRARRFGSAAELAADIRRHLCDEPVLAGPPTVRYRTGKFVRRHRLAVIAASLVTVGLTVGLLGTTAGLIRARRAEAAAREEAEKADRVAGFLANVLGSVDPDRMGKVLVDDLKQRAATAIRERGASKEKISSSIALLDAAFAGLIGTDTARRVLDVEILDRAGAAIDTEIANDPLIAAHLHHTIAQTYQSLGMYDAAERHAIRALDSRAALLGPDHPDTLQSRHTLGSTFYSQGRYTEAEDLLRSTVEARRRVLGPEHRDTLGSMSRLAFTLRAEAQFGEAEDLYTKALAILVPVYGREDRQTLDTMNDLGFLYQTMGRVEDAERVHREVLEIRTRLHGPESRDTLWSTYNVAWASMSLGRLDEAARLFAQCLEARRRVLGQDHPDTLWAMFMLARVRFNQGRFVEAEKLSAASLESRIRVLGTDHPDTLASIQLAGVFAYFSGRLEESRRDLEAALAGRRRVLGDDHGDTLWSAHSLRGVYWAGGWLEESRRLDRDLLPAWKKAAQREGATTIAKFGYASALLDEGHASKSEAEAALHDLLELARATDYRDEEVMNLLALGYHTAGNASDAVETQRKAIALVPDSERPLRAQFEARLRRYEEARRAEGGEKARPREHRRSGAR